MRRTVSDECRSTLMSRETYGASSTDADFDASDTPKEDRPRISETQYLFTTWKKKMMRMSGIG